MKTRPLSRKSAKSIIIVPLCVVTVLAFWALYQPSPVAAGVEPSPFSPGFAMFGITRTQTARLNVVNVTDVMGVDPSPFRVTLQLTFFDDQGVVLAQSAQTVTSGQAAYLDLDGNTLRARAGGRFQLRATVKALSADGRRLKKDEPAWAASLEVFDNTTATTAYIHPSVIVGFNPQPDPPATR